MDNIKDRPKPQVQADKGGGSGKSPRTAVGTAHMPSRPSKDEIVGAIREMSVSDLKELSSILKRELLDRRRSGTRG